LTHVTSASGLLVVVDAALFPLWLDRPAKLRKRIDKAVRKRGAGQFEHEDVAAVAVAVPPGRYPVLPESRGEEVDVVVRVQTIAQASCEDVGAVPVDAARLLVADPEALSAWESDASIDGLSDLSLWGRDVEPAARLLDEAPLEDGVIRWRDLEPGKAEARAQELAERCERAGLAVAVHAQPHSHYWLLCMRSDGSDNGLASLELSGGSVVCGVATEADGQFAVEVDFADTDVPAAIRIRSALPGLPA
jgi:hypothetical protein